jgi:hypothetical protein
MEKNATLIRQLQREVERQCRFAMISFQDIEEASANSDGRLFWYSVQGLLFSLDRISRLLWPGKPRSPGRGEDLRESLGVTGDSPLKNDEFVKRFLDFDVQLEEWHETSEARRFFDSYTEPLDVLAETTSSDRFRGYDTENNALLMHEELYYLDPVADAVEDLARKAEAEMAKPRFDLG